LNKKFLSYGKLGNRKDAQRYLKSRFSLSWTRISFSKVGMAIKKIGWGIKRPGFPCFEQGFFYLMESWANKKMH
jgi:hypothetical protein